MRLLFYLVVSLLSLGAAAQNKVTLNGYIRDSATGESVIGATISVLGHSAATISNQYGFYSITLDTGTYNISIAHVSFLVQVAQFNLQKDTSISFQLLSKA